MYLLVTNRYVTPEQVPVQYGGLSREGEQEFTVADSVTEVTIKPTTKHAVELSFSEVGIYIYYSYLESGMYK